MSLVIFIMAWMDRQRRGFIFCVCLLVLTLCVEALFYSGWNKKNSRHT